MARVGLPRTLVDGRFTQGCGVTRLALHHIPVDFDAGDVGTAGVAISRYFDGGGQDSGEPVRISLHASPPREVPPGQQILFHGLIRGFADGELIRLWDGYSWLTIDPRQATLRADLAPETLREPDKLANVLFFIGLTVLVRAQGLFHLHAGSVVDSEGRGTLVVGDRGAGKTTTTMALVAGGWPYLGDDALWLMDAGLGLSLLGIDRPFHLGHETAAMFPELRARMRRCTAVDGKAYDLEPEELQGGNRVQANDKPGWLLFPSIVDAPRSHVEKMDDAEAFAALIRSSATVLVNELPRQDEHLGVLRRLLECTAAFRLVLGRDVLDEPQRIVELVCSVTA